MSSSNILPDGVFEGVHIIGYLPTKFDPAVPDAVLIEQGGIQKVLFKDRKEKLCTDREQAAAVKADLHIGAKEWLVINDGNIQPMSLSDIGGWRDRVAVELVQHAMEIRGEPLRVLNMLESAAKLRSLDLADFVSVLNTQRANEDESLGEVFLRVRGSRPEGQTGE
jgi:hypothetical protein